MLTRKGVQVLRSRAAAGGGSLNASYDGALDTAQARLGQQNSSMKVHFCLVACIRAVLCACGCCHVAAATQGSPRRWQQSLPIFTPDRGNGACPNAIFMTLNAYACRHAVRRLLHGTRSTSLSPKPMTCAPACSPSSRSLGSFYTSFSSHCGVCKMSCGSCKMCTSPCACPSLRVSAACMCVGQGGTAGRGLYGRARGLPALAAGQHRL